jgi:hypothetical protein
VKHTTRTFGTTDLFPLTVIILHRRHDLFIAFIVGYGCAISADGGWSIPKSGTGEEKVGE